jgi:phosphoglycolate phosphatase
LETLHAVVFDFDFTLADSSAGAIECINFALAQLNLPQVSPERARKTIGLSLPETFLSLTGINDQALASDFANYFVQRADQVMESLTYIYDAVPQTIDSLRSFGIGLGIFSTKFRYRIENTLARERLLDRFDVIVGGRDVTKLKPDPAGLCRALTQLGVGAGGAIYVGDHVVDAEAAERAGVPFIAVLSGTCREDDFEGYQVQALVDGVGGLVNVLGLEDRSS